MALSTIPENTTAFLTVAFKDKNGDPETPATAAWLAIDLYSGEILQPETALSPAASIEITIPASVNAIQNENLPKETRRVIVKATYGGSQSLNQKFDYIVENLEQI